MDGWTSGDILLLPRQDVHISQGYNRPVHVKRAFPSIVIMVAFCGGISHQQKRFLLPCICLPAIVTSSSIVCSNFIALGDSHLTVPGSQDP